MRNEKFMHNFVREQSIWRIKHEREDNVKTDIKETWHESSNRIHVARDKELWLARVDTVHMMNLRVQQTAGYFSTRWVTLASQTGRFSIQLIKRNSQCTVCQAHRTQDVEHVPVSISWGTLETTSISFTGTDVQFYRSQDVLNNEQQRRKGVFCEARAKMFM